MKSVILSMAAALALSSALNAQDETQALKAQLKQLQERLEKLENQSKQTQEKTDTLLVELANQKVADSFGEYNGESYSGLAPGLSKVYTNKNRLSIGGYGKVDYTNYRDEKYNSDGKTRDNTDAYRAVFYFGYRFSDTIILNSEIEFEHGGSDQEGSSEVEMLTLDFLLDEAINFRVGTYVLPIGLVNVNHEPTLFNTVQRPTTEKVVIPSTWYENGVMLYGSSLHDTFSYKVGIVAGFDATQGATLRKMRSKGSKSPAEDAGYYLRLDYAPSTHFNLAAAYYYSKASQGNTEQNGAKLNDLDVNLWEVHASARYAGFEANALYAQHRISEAATLARYHNTEATEKAFGYYANINYTYGPWVPFMQYERSNAYDKGVDAAAQSFSYEDTQEITVGLNYKPHPQVVLKTDYVFAKTGQREKQIDDDRFELGMGFVF